MSTVPSETIQAQQIPDVVWCIECGCHHDFWNGKIHNAADCCEVEEQFAEYVAKLPEDWENDYVAYSTVAGGYMIIPQVVDPIEGVHFSLYIAV